MRVIENPNTLNKKFQVRQSGGLEYQTDSKDELSNSNDELSNSNDELSIIQVKLLVTQDKYLDT
jgi:hypothetical protein